MKKLLFAVVAAVVSPLLWAEDEALAQPVPEGGFVQSGESVETGFWGWRVSAGGRIGFGLKTKLWCGMPRGANSMATSPALGSPADIAKRLANGERLSFLDGAFIDPSSGNMSSPYTQNWHIPVSALDTSTGEVTLQSAQSAAVGTAGSDDEYAYGASIELSRTLYAHEKGFGVDCAIGVSWMRRNNCFKSSASGTYSTTSTSVYTPTPGSVNQGVLTSPFLQPSGGYYGAGSSSGIGPVLDWSDLGPNTIAQDSRSGSYSIYASGDYEEWDLAFMLKPWWEVTDFWRLTGTAGVGVTRSELDCTVETLYGNGGRYSSHKTFDEWDCYGLAGLGTVFRLWRFDISVDVLYRFFQDDMDIHSDAVSGSVKRPSLLLCAAIGFEF